MSKGFRFRHPKNTTGNHSNSEDDLPSLTASWENLFSDNWSPTAPIASGPSVVTPPLSIGRWFRMSASVMLKTTQGIPERVTIAGVWKAISHRITDPRHCPICALLILASDISPLERCGGSCSQVSLRSCVYVMASEERSLPSASFNLSGPISSFVDGKILEGVITMRVDSSLGGLDLSTFSNLVTRGLVTPDASSSKISWRESGNLGVVIDDYTLSYLRRSKMITSIYTTN